MSDSIEIEAVRGHYSTTADTFATGYDWSDVALAAWLDAAGNAGLPNATIVSIEVGDPNTEAAIVEVSGRQYVLTVQDLGGSDKEVRAEALAAGEA